MSIAALVVNMELNYAKFSQNLNAVSTATTSAMRGIESAAGIARNALGGLAGVLTAGGIVAFAKTTIDSTAALKDMAESTGASVERISALQAVATRFGHDMAPVVTGLQKLDKQMVAVADGSQEAIGAFASIGISAQEVKARLNDPAGMLQLVSQRLAGFEEGAGKANVMMTLMGKSGANLAPYLNDLAGAGELLATRTNAQVEAADRFNNALSAMKEKAQNFAAPLILGLLPALERLLPLVAKLAEVALAAAAGFALLKVAGLLAAGFTALAGAVSTAVLAFQVAGSVSEALTMRLWGTQAAILSLTTGVGVLVAAFAGWKIGEYLRENFLEAQLAGIALVQGLMQAWEYLKFGFAAALEGMQTLWGSFIETIGKGLSKIPGLSESGNVLQSLGAAQKGRSLADLAAERDAAIAADAAIFAAMARDAGAEFMKLDAAAAKAYKTIGTPPDPKALDAYRKHLEALLNRLENTDTGVSAEFWKDLAILNKEFASKDPERYRKLVEELIKTTDFGKKSMKDMDDALKSQQDYMRSIGETTEELLKSAEAAERENQTIGKSAQQLAELTANRYAERMAIKQTDLDRLRGIEGREAEVFLIEQQIAALDRLRAAALDKQALTQQFENQVGFWQSVENVAHQTWNSIADGSKNLWQRVKDSAKNIFFDWLYQMTLKKWLFNVSASFSGAGVAGQAFGATGAAGSAAGSAMSVANLVSTVKTAYTALTEGISATWASTWTDMASSSVGQKLGLSAISADGNAVEMTQLGQSMGDAFATAGAGIIGAAIGAAIAGDKRFLGLSGGITASAGAMVGSYFGPIGALVGGVIGGAINAAFGMGPKKMKDSGIEGTFGGSGFTGNTYLDWKQEGGWFRSDRRGTNRSAIDGALDTALDASFLGLKLRIGGFAEALGIDTQAIADYTKTIHLSLKGLDDAGKQAKLEELLTGIGNDLADIALAGSNFGREGETSAQTLQRLSTSLIAVNGLFSRIDESLLDVSLAGGEAASRLLDAAGGFENLASAYVPLLDVMDATGNVFEDARVAGLSLASSYREQTDRAWSLIASFDGSLAGAQQLGNLMQQRYQTELQLLAQVDSALNGIGTSFGQAADRFRLDTLTPAQQYDFYDRRAAASLSMIQSLSDPALIKDYADQYLNALTSGWQLLDEQQKSMRLDDYLAALDKGQTAATERLQSVQDGLRQENQKTNDALIQAVKEIFGPLAAQLAEGSTLNLNQTIVTSGGTTQVRETIPLRP